MLENTINQKAVSKPGLVKHFLPGEWQQEELNLPEHPCTTQHKHWHRCSRHSHAELLPSSLPALAVSSWVRGALLKTGLGMWQVLWSEQASYGDKTGVQVQVEWERRSSVLDGAVIPSLAWTQPSPRPPQGHALPWKLCYLQKPLGMNIYPNSPLLLLITTDQLHSLSRV